MATRTLGLILAGGRSRRMGQDKAFVPLAGRPLIEHVIARLTPQVDAVVISSNTPRRFAAYSFPVLADRHGGFRGPLAGVYAALTAYPQDVVVSVAVDLPFLPRDLVAQLKQNWDGSRCRYAAQGCASAASAGRAGAAAAQGCASAASAGRAGAAAAQGCASPRRVGEHRTAASRSDPQGRGEAGHRRERLPDRADAAATVGAGHVLAVLWPPRCAAALGAYLNTNSAVSGWLATQGEPVLLPPDDRAALDINLNTPADLARAEALLVAPVR